MGVAIADVVRRQQVTLSRRVVGRYQSDAYETLSVRAACSRVHRSHCTGAERPLLRNLPSIVHPAANCRYLGTTMRFAGSFSGTFTGSLRSGSRSGRGGGTG